MQFSIYSKIFAIFIYASSAMAAPSPSQHKFSLNIAMDDGSDMPQGPCLKVCFPPDMPEDRCPAGSNWKKYVFGVSVNRKIRERKEG
jgi:hypothetical protein